MSKGTVSKAAGLLFVGHEGGSDKVAMSKQTMINNPNGKYLTFNNYKIYLIIIYDTNRPPKKKM